MPQMFPIMWLILFLFINLALLMVSNIMFFIMKTPVSLKENMINKTNHTWKW